MYKKNNSCYYMGCNREYIIYEHKMYVILMLFRCDYTGCNRESTTLL